MAAPAVTNPTIVEWVVDTRSLWPAAKKTEDLAEHAADFLALLSEKSREGVLRYYHVRDAKMALASALLKRYAISRLCVVPWAQALPVDGPNKKPTFPGLAFNVSHQAGIVALIAVHGYNGKVEVGIDVVSVIERRDSDHSRIRQGGQYKLDGFRDFVDVYNEVFGEGEAAYLASPRVLEGTGVLVAAAGRVISQEEVDARLRAFYSLWCIREAYVKMTGEALLAKWLPQLQIRDFRSPRPCGTAHFELLPFEHGHDDCVESQDAIMFEGAMVQDTNVVLRSTGTQYMICTALRTPDRKEDGLSFKIGAYTLLDVADMLRYAKSSEQ